MPTVTSEIKWLPIYEELTVGPVHCANSYVQAVSIRFIRVGVRQCDLRSLSTVEHFNCKDKR